VLGYQILPELLAQHGVDIVFSMLGGTNASWIASGVQDGRLRLVKTRHEETAVNAAVGYSRTTGRIGVCSVTRGPGFSNSVNALIAATRGHVPIMLIAGESPPSMKKFTEQHVDQKAFASLIGMGFHHAAQPEDLEREFWAAVDEAYRYGRPQLLSTGDAIVSHEASTAQVSLGPSHQTQTMAAPSSESVKAVVDLLERSVAPLILVGQGAVLSEAKAELEQLASLVGARLATTLRANRYFEGNERDLGLCGEWSLPPARSYIAESDAVLAFGASLNPNTTAEQTMFPGAKVVHCEINPDKPFKSSSPDLAVLGDVRATASAIIDEWGSRGLKARPAPKPSPRFSDMRQSLLENSLNHDPDRGLDLRDVFMAFDAKLPPDRIVITDSGRTKGLATLVGARDARSWLIGRGYGSVGLGLGTAIGASAAHPDRPVALFCGDGGFMMALAGLDSARLHDLNLIVVILNDEQLGAELKHLRRYRLPYDVAQQPLPDIPALASVYGGRGTVIRSPEDLASFEFQGSGLEIVDVRIDPLMESEGAFA
jgi:acetolactate synthase I/II/III large subunit